MDDTDLEDELARLRQDLTTGMVEPADAGAELADLTARTAELTDITRRGRAERELTALRRVVGYAAAVGPGDHASVVRASEVLVAASAPGGSADERIRRAEHGLAQLNRIAEQTTDPGDHAAVLELNAGLIRLIGAIRDGQSR
jgi:hypothetical protein